MRCPFPPCTWTGEPNRYLRAPGSTETNTVMPIHEVEGDGSWFGRCPASSLIVPEITAAGRDVLRAGLVTYMRMRTERMREAVAMRAAQRRAQRPQTLADYFTQRSSGETEIERLLRAHGPRVDPRVANDDYFPGRPADDPEPGLGEPPALPVPKHADTRPLGRAQRMDNARDNLNALIAASSASCDSVIEDLTRTLGQIERALAVLGVADDTAENTLNLMRVTIGIERDNLPESARTMVAMMRLAKSTMLGNADQSIAKELAAAKEAALAAMNQARASKEAAQEYLRMPK